MGYRTLCLRPQSRDFPGIFASRGCKRLRWLPDYITATLAGIVTTAQPHRANRLYYGHRPAPQPQPQAGYVYEDDRASVPSRPLILYYVLGIWHGILNGRMHLSYS